MNRNCVEGERQEAGKLKITKRASQMIQGLVMASVVSIASPAYSQEKKVDTGTTVTTANEVLEYVKILEGTKSGLKAEYISKKLRDGGKVEQFLHEIIKADSSPQANTDKSDLIGKILSKNKAFEKTFVGKTKGGYGILQQALILQAEQKALAIGGGANVIAKAVYEENYRTFTETASKELIQAIVADPKKFSPDQVKLITNVGVQLLGGEDIIKSKLNKWVGADHAKILKQAGGLYKVYETMHHDMQGKIALNLTKIKAQTDGTVATRQFLSEARSYMDLAQGLGELFGDAKVARDISETLFIANKVLDVVENANKLMGAANAMGSISSGNIIAASMSIVGVFAKQGPSIETQRHQQIMEELKKIGIQVNTLKKEMHDRFDLVDDKLDAISSQLRDMQGDITAIKASVDKGFDELSTKLETIKEDEFGNKYAGIKNGCYLRATAKTIKPTSQDLEECKGNLATMAISDATNFTFTGRGMNPVTKDFADAFNRRGTEYSINMVRNVLATGSIEFGPGNKTGTDVVNPIISQRILDDYLTILEKHGMTEIDISRMGNIRKVLDELDGESRKMASMSENSFLDMALKLYENKYSQFNEKLTAEIHNFEDQRTEDILKKATAEKQPHAAGIKKIQLLGSGFTGTDNPNQTIAMALDNWLIYKQEHLTGNTPPSMGNNAGHHLVSFNIMVHDIYTPYHGVWSFSIPNRGYKNTLTAEVTGGGVYETKRGTGKHGFKCWESSVHLGDFRPQEYVGSDCIKAIEEMLIKTRLKPISTLEGEAEKKKLATSVQNQYISLRKHLSGYIESRLADTSRPIRTAFDEWRAAYALINALSYLGLQFHREHDAVLAQSLAKLNPENIKIQLSKVGYGQELSWNPLWNNDPLSMKEAFGNLLAAGPLTQEVRKKIGDIVSHQPIIGLQSVKDMNAAIKAVEYGQKKPKP